MNLLTRTKVGATLAEIECIPTVCIDGCTHHLFREVGGRFIDPTTGESGLRKLEHIDQHPKDRCQRRGIHGAESLPESFAVDGPQLVQYHAPVLATESA